MQFRLQFQLWQFQLNSNSNTGNSNSIPIPVRLGKANSISIPIPELELELARKSNSGPELAPALVVSTTYYVSRVHCTFEYIHRYHRFMLENLPGHDIGHWPAGPTAIFSRRASRATSMHFLLARWGHQATDRATGWSGGHWPDAVGGSVCKAHANNRQSPVY